MIDTTQKNDGFWGHFKIEEPTETTIHQTVVDMGKSEKIDTEDLISFARHFIQVEWERGEEALNPGLLVLQQRTTRPMVNRIEELCNSTDPLDRYLGVSILREFPGLDQPKPFVSEALSMLEFLVDQEPEEMILATAISAVGWQKDPRAIPIMLRFAQHPSPWVRLMVADNLTMNCTEKEPFPEKVATAYKAFIIDDDLDVRWYSFATLNEIPEQHGKTLTLQNQSDLLLLFKTGLRDPNDLVRQEAHEGYQKLMELEGF